MRAFFFVFAFIFLASLSVSFAEPAVVVVYKNEACGHCDMYLYQFRNFLSERNISYQEKMMINDPEVREEVSRLHSERGIPLEMQGHMIATFGNLTLEGHVPIEIIGSLLEQYPDYDFPNYVIYQDDMLDFDQLREMSKGYKLSLSSSGMNGINSRIIECNIESSVQECAESGNVQRSSDILPLVLFTGLVDGINPCAFGVLLFFIALLYTMKRTKADLLKVGAVYISMIFLAYFLIGLGILQAIELSSSPHFIAVVAAYLIIILGIVNIKDYFFYGRTPPKGLVGKLLGFSLRIPGSQTKRIKHWMSKGTLLSVVVLGFLVGLCTFPCSGGIYVGILGMLSVSTTYAQGLAYLVLYNIMFVLPLVIILALALNPVVVKRMEKAEKSGKKWMKLMNGLVMIGLGLFMLFSGII